MASSAATWGQTTAGALYAKHERTNSAHYTGGTEILNKLCKKKGTLKAARMEACNKVNNRDA